MLQMLRTAAARVLPAAPAVRPHVEFMLYRDGAPFMIINAPSLDHARYIVAGFSADHSWLLVER